MVGAFGQAEIVENYVAACPCGQKVKFNKELTSAVFRIVSAGIVAPDAEKAADDFKKSDYTNFDEYCQNKKKGPLPKVNGIDWTLEIPRDDKGQK